MLLGIVAASAQITLSFLQLIVNVVITKVPYCRSSRVWGQALWLYNYTGLGLFQILNRRLLKTIYVQLIILT